MFTQVGFENVARLLHQRVTVATAFDDAGFESIGAVADLTCRDAFQEFIALFLQRLDTSDVQLSLPARLRPKALLLSSSEASFFMAYWTFLRKISV